MSISTIPNPVRVAVATTVVAILAVGAVGLAENGHHSGRSSVPDAPTSHPLIGIRDLHAGPTTSGGKVMLGQ